jgi:hypothetical protein
MTGCMASVNYWMCNKAILGWKNSLWLLGMFFLTRMRFPPVVKERHTRA